MDEGGDVIAGDVDSKPPLGVSGAERSDHGASATAIPTPNERPTLEAIADRVDRLRSFLDGHPTAPSDAPPLDWLTCLAEAKRILGNASNDLGFVTTLLAHRYLERRLPMAPMDAAGKAQGASGPDIDARTRDGARVVGEIKATVPYHGTKLGANQLLSWHKDFKKLAAAYARRKFFFVVDAEAFRLARDEYAHLLPGVRVVLLTNDGAHDCPLP